jgi:hypothetical protein
LRNAQDASAPLGPFGSVNDAYFGSVVPPDQKWFMPWISQRSPIRQPLGSR